MTSELSLEGWVVMRSGEKRKGKEILAGEETARAKMRRLERGYWGPKTGRGKDEMKKTISRWGTKGRSTSPRVPGHSREKARKKTQKGLILLHCPFQPVSLFPGRTLPSCSRIAVLPLQATSKT